MDYADIRRLVKLVETSNISEIEIEEGGSKLRILKQSAVTTPSGFALPAPQMVYQPPMATVVTGQGDSSPVPVQAAPAKKTIDVMSPMVGTFYRAPSPEAPVYVNVGDTVKPGQVLCIVEAMKLMNEIECEVSGKIVEILPQNAHPVEFGQILFRIEPIG